MMEEKMATQSRADIKTGVVKWIVKNLIVDLILAVVLFLAAGRLDWRGAWLYLGLVLLGQVINALILIPISPDLIAERAVLQPGTKRWDLLLALLLAYHPIYVGIVAGLDVRLGWSPSFPLALQGIGVIVALGGSLFTTWAMASNRFFSGTVRIQTERDHQVATHGPYAHVRHPGYSSMLIFGLATPLILGSRWAFLPLALTVAVIVIRTALEDRTLHEELDGYRLYAGRVRYRLFPGLW
jgi:protein-S-isoprenylcysteine O-methyltransferase Ste14